jgi:hypothetical protein
VHVVLNWAVAIDEIRLQGWVNGLFLREGAKTSRNVT